MGDADPYNPAAPENLGLSVADALLKRTAHNLGAIKSFAGAGIYAIYYTGRFRAYRTVVARNRDGKFGAPIYVGKAIPEGGRKGGKVGGEYSGNALFRRLSEHAESIRAASTTLKLDDFHCRYLVVHEVWIAMAESLLIARFAPIWNNLIDGFGNHDPGAGRYNGMRPRWDVIHPGRHWAAKCRERPDTAEQIAKEVEAYLKVAPNGLRELTFDDLNGDPNSET